MSELGERLTIAEALGREADAWVMLIASGRATRDDARALRLWRARSASHEDAYVQAASLRRSVLVAAAQIRVDEAAASVDEGQASSRAASSIATATSRGVSRRHVMRGAIAASVAGTVITLTGAELGFWGQGPEAEFTTRKGERRVIQLAGGAQVDLNTATRLSRRPDLGARAVELFDGEMTLSAPLRDGNAFMILAGSGRTMTADGGRVALRCEDDAVSVTCLAGRAVVQMGAAERLIMPGQQLRYDDGGLGQLVAINPAVVTAWQRGVLVFRRARVGDVIAEIERYRDGRIVIANPTLADRRIDGTFPIGRVEAIFEQLRSVYGASVRHLPGDVVVLT